MKYSNRTKRIRLFLCLLYFILTPNIFAKITTTECQHCFTSKVISVTEEDECLTFELNINADSCLHALSHFTVNVPCGTVSDASNSENWPMEFNSIDPTSNLKGLKVDDIADFGEDGRQQSFTVNFTVCSDDPECRKQLNGEGLIVAYKAGTCVFFDTIPVMDQSLEASLKPTHIKCFGKANGSIELTITNGVPPYLINWSNGSTSQNLENLNEGIYSVVITDANGQQLELNTEIYQPEAIKTSADIAHTTCGANDGYISITASGGTLPYKYEWNNGSSSNKLTELSGGTYILTLTDSLGCLHYKTVTIKEETTLTATISLDQIKCHEEGQGQLIVNASGGKPPYNYLWEDGTKNDTITGLNSGTHRVTITDATGCSIEKNGYVIKENLSINVVVDQPNCPEDGEGSASLSITNGTEPYEVVWSTGSTSAELNDIPVGWYWVEVTDANGCTSKKYFSVKAPEALNITASVQRVTCADADSSILVNVNVNGGTSPYELLYNNEISDSSLEVQETGYYTFTATDANGCSVTQDILVERPSANLNAEAYVTQPDCQYSEYGQVSILVKDGSAPYTATWSDGSTSLSRNDLEPGVYQVTVKDVRACEQELEVTIEAPQWPQVIINPPVQPICASESNNITAIIDHYTSFEWSASNSAEGWSITNQTAESASYTAGTGEAWIILTAENAFGCMMTDSILVSCQVNDDPPGGDDDQTGDNDGNNNPPSDDDDDCNNNCYSPTSVRLTATEDNCYSYLLRVTTNGDCIHELSHLTVGINDGQVSLVTSSQKWKTELNSEDPTTGIWGFKVDNIENFGHEEDYFDINFDVCFNTDQPQTNFLVAYKSGQCIHTDTVSFSNSFAFNALAESYPNPFTDQTTVSFVAPDNQYTNVSVYNINGKLVECLFDGYAEEGVKYDLKFSPEDTNEHIFFYRIICGQHLEQGKLLKSN